MCYITQDSNGCLKFLLSLYSLANDGAKLTMERVHIVTDIVCRSNQNKRRTDGSNLDSRDEHTFSEGNFGRFKSQFFGSVASTSGGNGYDLIGGCDGCFVP
ncbi:hypothetical protein VNO77_13758 [Canavalia gladiata]|uniref:Uncharacterized protein n=1 Tax=Canavalia gladiata TaxID=3824 RepID=A0AAN9LYU5_CANGL